LVVEVLATGVEWLEPSLVARIAMLVMCQAGPQALRPPGQALSRPGQALSIGLASEGLGPGLRFC